MEEVDKGCSKFGLTVGTATRTAGILIHNRLKALAVNLSRPSSRLWLYAGLKRPLLSVRILLLPHGCEWVNISSGTGQPG